jgi:phage terminase small subunit
VPQTQLNSIRNNPSYSKLKGQKEDKKKTKRRQKEDKKKTKRRQKEDKKFTQPTPDGPTYPDPLHEHPTQRALREAFQVLPFHSISDGPKGAYCTEYVQYSTVMSVLVGNAARSTYADSVRVRT